MDRSISLKHDGLGRRWLQSTPLPLSSKSLIGPLFVAIAYYLGARAAFAVGTLSDRIFAPFWPPNIILFTALLLAPKRRWWIYIAAAFPLHVMAEVSVGMPPAQYLVAFGTNCMVAILSAAGVRRFLKEPPWFGTLLNAGTYILIAAALSPAISAFGGAFVQILGGGSIATYWIFWGNWFIANALGSMTLGPVFLLWASSRPKAAWFTPRRTVEGVAMVLSLVVTCAIAFHEGSETLNSGFLPALLYLPLPIILWAAVRFGQRGATGAILVVTVVSIWQSLHDSTVFIGVDPPTSVLGLQVFLLGIAIPVFLLGAAIDELRRSGEATRELAGALLRAQDEERRRIARELHDSTGQNIAVANLMAAHAQSMATPACGAVLDELKDVLEKAMTEIRTVSYVLHPPLLDAGGLSIALRSYLEGFSKRTGLTVYLDIPPNFGRLSSEVELVLFRVIQEALTNVWRHSGSRTARIQLMRQSQDRPYVALSIEDAGKGIPDNILSSRRSSGEGVLPASSGLGLAGMRERLHQIGGRLEIESTTGKTVIRATVTLNDEAKEHQNE
jgi:signal transduction histidine kinase